MPLPVWNSESTIREAVNMTEASGAKNRERNQCSGSVVSQDSAKCQMPLASGNAKRVIVLHAYP